MDRSEPAVWFRRVNVRFSIGSLAIAGSSGAGPACSWGPMDGRDRQNHGIAGSASFGSFGPCSHSVFSCDSGTALGRARI